MLAEMPVSHTAKDYPAHFVQERQTFVASGSRHAKLSKAMNVWLFFRNLTGRHVHNNGIRARPCERNTEHFRDTRAVAKQIGRPQRIYLFEKSWNSYGDRIDRTDTSLHVKFAFEFHQTRCHQIGIGGTKRPEQIVLERHARSPLLSVAILLKLACLTIDLLAAENKSSLEGELRDSKSFAFPVISLSSIFPPKLDKENRCDEDNKDSRGAARDGRRAGVWCECFECRRYAQPVSASGANQVSRRECVQRAERVQDQGERLPGQEFLQGQRLRRHERRQNLHGQRRPCRDEGAHGDVVSDR